MELVPLGPGFTAELRGVDLIDVVSSDDLDGGIAYPYSDDHPRALDNVDAKPLP